MKEIIFVSNDLKGGGAARVLLELAGKFAENGFDVSILSYSQGLGSYEIPDGVSVIFYPYVCKSAYDKIKRCHWLRSYFKSHENACVIAFEYFVNVHVLYALRGLKNKVIVSERNDPAREGGHFPMDQMRKYYYKKADCVVFQTNQAMEYFTSVKGIKGRVILNPIKSDLPGAFECIRSHRVVTFCRLEKQKNLKLLIDAFDEFYVSHKDYNLEIYGNGSLKNELLEHSKRLNSSNSIKFFPARKDIHSQILDASMFVLPSDYEGLSNSMLEAMAIGLPVICTDCPCGGASMVIDDGRNGFLFKPGDKASLVNLMMQVADNEEISRKISKNALKIKKKCSVDSIFLQWLGIVIDE